MGFDKIFFNIKFDSGNIDAAPAKKAADDGSPGISTLSGLRAWIGGVRQMLLFVFLIFYQNQ